VQHHPYTALTLVLSSHHLYYLLFYSLLLSSYPSVLNRLTELHLNAKKAREAEKEMKAELEGGVEQLNKMLVRVLACLRAYSTVMWILDSSLCVCQCRNVPAIDGLYSTNILKSYFPAH
jgi:hypothetical protein